MNGPALTFFWLTQQHQQHQLCESARFSSRIMIFCFKHFLESSSRHRIRCLLFTFHFLEFRRWMSLQSSYILRALIKIHLLLCMFVCLSLFAGAPPLLILQKVSNFAHFALTLTHSKIVYQWRWNKWASTMTGEDLESSWLMYFSSLSSIFLLSFPLLLFTPFLLLFYF